MQVHGHSKRVYMALGKMLLHKHPDIAETLLPYCQVTGESDLSKLPVYFKRFCEIRNIEPTEHKGNIKNTDQKNKMHERRLFIACVLHIYNQHIFHVDGTTPIMRTGFVKAISDCNSIDLSNASQTIRKVIFFEKVYEDFRNEIKETVLKLKEAIIQNGNS